MASARQPLARLLCVLALFVWVACVPSPRDAAYTTANVIEATGQVQIALLNTCSVVLRREALTARRAVEALEAGQPPPITMSDAQVAAVVEVCDDVAATYDVVQSTHAAMLAAVKLAEATNADADWLAVAALAADALAATERARQAVTRARAVLQ